MKFKLSTSVIAVAFFWPLSGTVGPAAIASVTEQTAPEPVPLGTVFLYNYRAYQTIAGGCQAGTTAARAFHDGTAICAPLARSTFGLSSRPAWALPANHPRRWGGLDLLIGRTFDKNTGALGSGTQYSYTFSWLVPGQVLLQNTQIDGTSYPQHWVLDPTTGFLLGNTPLPDGSFATTPVPDGRRMSRSIYRVINDNSFETIGQVGDGTNWNTRMMGRTVYQSQQAIQMQRAERDAFWSGVLSATTTAIQAAAPIVQAEAAASQAELDRAIDATNRASSGYSLVPSSGGAVTQNRIGIAHSQDGQQQPRAPAATTSPGSDTSAARTAGSLRFALAVPITQHFTNRNTGGEMNTFCYSEVMEVQSLDIAESYKPRHLAACARAGHTPFPGQPASIITDNNVSTVEEAIAAAIRQGHPTVSLE